MVNGGHLIEIFAKLLQHAAKAAIFNVDAVAAEIDRRVLLIDITAAPSFSKASQHHFAIIQRHR